MGLLREKGAADCPCQAILVKGFGHRLPKGLLTIPHFSERSSAFPIHLPDFVRGAS